MKVQFINHMPTVKSIEQLESNKFKINVYPVEKIFEPDNYYSKIITDSLLDNKINTANESNLSVANSVKWNGKELVVISQTDFDLLTDFTGIIHMTPIE